MSPIPFRLFRSVAVSVAALVIGTVHPALRGAEPPHAPAVGEAAPNFTLTELDGGRVELAKLTAQKKVVLVVLRGWPGYQCPICSRQVNEFIGRKADFDQRGVAVVMVYPGPAEELQAHAEEFRTWRGREWPAGWHYVLDPGYAFTNAYGLRWDAPRETAYPSTFIIGAGNKVGFAEVSTSHGGRVSAQAALDALDAMK